MAEVEKLGASFTEVKDQATALMEVAAGTSDAAVIDSLMAGAMVGEGTSYDSLTYTVSLNAEEGEQYGVGFRQGSDLAAALNDFFARRLRRRFHAGLRRDLRHPGCPDRAVTLQISISPDFPGKSCRGNRCVFFICFSTLFMIELPRLHRRRYTL